MKKQILNIGNPLSRAEQKQVFGGAELSFGDDESSGCYNSNATCRTDKETKCCTGSYQAASSEVVVGVCMP